jgi:hypothetical protein
MTAEIINLRQVRKQRERDAKEGRSAENRARFGRTKGERALDEKTSEREERRLEGHLREVSVQQPEPSANATGDAPAVPPTPKPVR